jgi:glutathione synthase
MSLKILFISEPLGTKETRDGTIIADEAKARGHKVSEIRPHEITFREGTLYGGEYVLEEFDVIHFRPNPPVDMTYLTNLYLLDKIKDKVLIINSPEAIIKFPEKIFPLDFYDFMPPTIITSSLEELKKFCTKHGEIVIKPLYDFGGNDVLKFNAANINQFSFGNSTLPITAQKFLPSVEKGDKRVLILDGEVESVFLRVPKKDDFRANTVHGSTLAKTELSGREQELCDILRPYFKNNGIMICGLDLIDGYLTEINITSPAGFRFTKEIYSTTPEKKLWNIIESKLN